MESANNKIWKCEISVKKGKRHVQKNMLCQDRVAYRREGTKQSIALRDGIGKTDLNVIAGEKTVEIVNEFLIRRFDEFRTDKRKGVGHALIKEIYGVYGDMMEQFSQPVSEFASTILGLCIDTETNEYCAIHLGDGAILCRGDRNRVLSYPVNGMTKDETYLTTSAHIPEKMKLYRGTLDQITAFVLCSDGVYEERKKLWDIFGYLEQEERSIELPERDDDQSIIQLKKVN